MFRVHQLKLRAAGLGIRRLEIGATAGVVEFASEHRVDPARVIRLVQHSDGRFRLDGSHRLRIRLAGADGPARLKVADEFLATLEA
jgi:transcription-repair coupling factor (superfamily II helicase)